MKKLIFTAMLLAATPSFAMQDCKIDADTNFRAFDKNGDGVIRRDEAFSIIRDVMEDMNNDYKAVLAHINGEFAAADRNRDGKIEWDERKNLKLKNCAGVIDDNQQ